jgi:hypothetical protein
MNQQSLEYSAVTCNCQKQELSVVHKLKAFGSILDTAILERLHGFPEFFQCECWYGNYIK